MPILPEISDLDLIMINILIKKAQKEQNITYERPCLQLPVPHLPENPEFYEKPDKKQTTTQYPRKILK